MACGEIRGEGGFWKNYPSTEARLVEKYGFGTDSLTSEEFGTLDNVGKVYRLSELYNSIDFEWEANWTPWSEQLQNIARQRRRRLGESLSRMGRCLLVDR